MERTFCIFKPDLTASHQNTGEALATLLMYGFMPVAMRKETIDLLKAMDLYSEHEGKTYYGPNIDFVTSAPAILMVLEGRLGACELLRDVVGATDPVYAMAGTLRKLYGTELPKNAVHASADAEAAEREISIFFPKLAR